MARRPSITNMSVADLHAEIRRRERATKGLLRRRRSLLAKLARLEAQIAEAGGQAGGRGSRPKNEMSLVESLRAVLKGKTMGPSEAAEAVKKAGYRTSSANFRTMVNIALSKKGNKFKRVERGLYTAG